MRVVAPNLKQNGQRRLTEVLAPVEWADVVEASKRDRGALGKLRHVSQLGKRAGAYWHSGVWPSSAGLSHPEQTRLRAQGSQTSIVSSSETAPP